MTMRVEVVKKGDKWGYRGKPNNTPEDHEYTIEGGPFDSLDEALEDIDKQDEHEHDYFVVVDTEDGAEVTGEDAQAFFEPGDKDGGVATATSNTHSDIYGDSNA